MQATKTFKIGEYAVGGIIKVDVTGKVIQVKNLDWNTKEEVKSGSCMTYEPNAKAKLMDYLEDVTSYYYAEKVMKWIESVVTLG
jgi:hypothetical protein